MGLIFKFIASLASFIALGILALSLSAGLYFACDIAEEYASVTKRWLSIGTISIIVIHLLLLFGGFPYMNVGIGIAAHLSYLPLLKTFPYVEPVSVALIFAVMVSAANHMNWFHFFVDQFTARDSILDRDELTAIRVVGCIFVFVWLIPMGFFVSLSSADDCLPTSSGFKGDYNDGSNSTGKKKKGIFKTFMNSILKNRWPSGPEPNKFY